MSGYAVYSRAQNVTEDSRAIEYRLLAQVTAALNRAKESKGDMPKLVDAVLWNKQVWDALMCDLAGEGNRLPKDLRAKLIGLALWVARETASVMDGAGDLDALIGINRTIMQGLSPSATGQAAVSAAR